MKTIEQLLAEQEERARYAWVPACNGTEEPFNYRGYRLQYMWNQVTGKHAYYRFDHDMMYVDIDCTEVA